ncbi:hypothetical protein F2Q69_00044198 [Brassica cretica]|uniref:Glycosyltransferase N-terminal domain-containing protein n=1 Tax=Brassica cretica TaxID=69181 RepID=A0A8S9NBX4_BRACR|nr:hypothetical protein F2Q69_00044198 [Brassica cretica]
MDEKLVKKRRIVLVPVPAQGHVTPIMQLGKALHSKGFSITVIQTQYNRVSSSKDFSDFNFLTIPGSLTDSDLKNLGPVQFLMKLNQACEASFKQCLGQILKEQGDDDEIACVIYDEYMSLSKAAAKEFQLPSVVFSTTSATAFLCRSVIAKVNADKFLIDMKDLELQDKLFPGLHPLRYKDLPTSAFGPLESIPRVYSETVNTGTASAVIINTANCLESSSLARLQRELQVPVYPIGPLHIAASAPSSLLEEDRSCIEWLNMQKPRSVIYISLGSLALMESKDTLEMAWGKKIKEVEAFAQLIPRIVKAVQSLTVQKHLTITPYNVSYVPMSGLNRLNCHCGVYTIKHIECHVLGLEIFLVSDDNIWGARIKIVWGLWEAANDPELIERMSKYEPNNCSKPAEYVEIDDL